MKKSSVILYQSGVIRELHSEVSKLRNVIRSLRGDSRHSRRKTADAVAQLAGARSRELRPFVGGAMKGGED